MNHTMRHPSYGGIKIPEMKVSEIDASRYAGRYPKGVDLRPNSADHGRILSEILDRASLARTAMSRRFELWDKISRNLTAYVPPEEASNSSNSSSHDEEKYIVMPLSYTVVETIATYILATFLREPIFSYNPVATEDIVPVALLELVIQNQMNNFKGGLAIYKAIRDMLVYGIGVLSPVWEKKMGYKSIRNIDLGGNERINIEPLRQRVVLFEGNKLECWDPYTVIFDPNIPLDRIQDGEFFGGVERLSKNTLLNLEAASPDEYFNCRYVEYIDGRSRIIPMTSGDSRTEKWGFQSANNGRFSSSVDLIHLYVNLIPSDWGLGDGNDPEKWIFTVAGDSIIIRARPTGLDHDMFPVGVMCPLYDGHSTTAMSILEVVFGMQDVVDKLVKSWWANTRKAVNNVYIYDPGSVHVKDMQNIALHGGLIRTSMNMWGRGVQDPIKQLPVVNVTEHNLNYVSMIVSMISNLVGATEPIQGIRRMHGGERVTATEVSQLFQAGFSKMERLSSIAWKQGLYDISCMLAMQTIQLMQNEMYVRIVGSRLEELKEEYGLGDYHIVTPDVLDVAFDVVVNDGTIPGSGDPMVWQSILQIISNNQAFSDLDPVKVFMHWARLAGAKDVHAFRRRKGVVMPDEETEKQARAGNLIPVEEVLQKI